MTSNSCGQHIPDNQAHVSAAASSLATFCEASTHGAAAQVYRLSGDYNSLHIDPEQAKFGGFEDVILHGLCTFGHCGHMLLGALCGSDPSRFKKIKVRFSSPVMLNDTLRVRAWHDGPGRVLFEADVDGNVVVSNAYFEYEEPGAKL